MQRVLRPAASGDAPALLGLAREMALAGAGQGVPDGEAAGQAWAERWVRAHAQPGRLMLVADVDGRVAGFATLCAGPSPQLSHVAQLSLFVSSECRRQGMGRSLLDAVLRWAGNDTGIDKLQLAVLASNLAAVRLYRRCGFRQEGRLRGQMRRPDGRLDDQLLMARRVEAVGMPAGQAAVPDPAGAAPRTTLERHVRLGESMLWTLQRRYFMQQGLAAWRSGAVPHYITSNPVIADAYAALVAAWQADLDAGGAGGPQPLHVIELGAGCGRFAFHFLRCFFGDPAAAAVAPGLVYVMTDVVEANLSFWQSHPRLRPWVDAGRLDFARFDPAADDSVELRVSGRRLVAGSLERPPVVIANYVLDGLPQDAFAIAGGQLAELTVSLHDPASPHGADDAALLGRLVIEFGRTGPVAADRYADPLRAALLDGYRERLDGTTVLMPTTAMGCLDRLQRLARGSLLFVAADRGWVDEQAMAGHGDPQPARHGSFSLPVNFHAIGQMAMARGGEYWFPRRHAQRLAICACVLGAPSGARSRTRGAYDRLVAQTGPDDAYTLKNALQRVQAELDLDELLAWLRTSRCDPQVLLQCHAGLMRQLPRADAAQRRELSRVVAQVWDNFYAIGDDGDLALALGTLLATAGAYAQARPLLEESLRVHGPSHSASLGLAICHQRLGDRDRACAHAQRAVDLAPTPSAAAAASAALESMAG